MSIDGNLEEDCGLLDPGGPGAYSSLNSAWGRSSGKGTRSAVLNAASVARMVLTTETAVVEKPVEEEDEHAGHHHGHAH